MRRYFLLWVSLAAASCAKGRASADAGATSIDRVTAIASASAPAPASASASAPVAADTSAVCVDGEVVIEARGLRISSGPARPYVGFGPVGAGALHLKSMIAAPSGAAADALGRALCDRTPKLRACFDAERKAHPDLQAGWSTLSLTVARGVVTDGRVARPSLGALGQATLTRCLIDATKGAPGVDGIYEALVGVQSELASRGVASQPSTAR